MSICWQKMLLDVFAQLQGINYEKKINNMVNTSCLKGSYSVGCRQWD